MVLLGAVGAVNCYNPKISNQLHCAEASAKRCPDGFFCAGNLCVREGGSGSGGTNGSGGANGSGGLIGSGGGPGTGGMGTGGQGGARGEGESCLIINGGQPSQTDNCSTGLVCLEDCATARCYRLCQGDGDCPSSACTRSAPGGSPRVCERPFVECNPLAIGADLGGCDAYGCYLLSHQPSPTGGDRTVCDCSMPAGGAGSTCSDSRNCFRGLVCPPAGAGPGAGRCQKLCDPEMAASGCPTGTTCQLFGANWGYCF